MPPPMPNELSARCIDHPSGFLALSAKNQCFMLSEVPGFVAYRRQGCHLIVFGGFHAECLQAAGNLVDGFIKFAEVQGRGVVVVQAREAQADLLRDRGFTVNQFGSNFGLPLAEHSLAGTPKMKLRNKIKRAHRAGLEVSELGRELPKNRATFEHLYRISRAWLAGKHKKELDFMVGEIGSPDENLRRIFLVRDAQGEPQAFITYVPAWCERPGMLHDLTRRRPGAPPGAMELCNAFAMERLREEGVAFLHFGFTPFIVDEKEPAGANSVFSWLIRKLYCHGAAIYPAETQAQYKLKWGIEFIEREYIAARPLSMRAAIDLLWVTRSF